ncbi:MAG: Poly(beta-D-mannuronate) epimerase 5 [Cyanobacteriota bacterium]|jgi:hypothetical protein
MSNTDLLLNSIIAPDVDIAGHSQVYWSVEWWRYIYSLPTNNHPMYDETGEQAATGQEPPVFHLLGVYNESATAERNVELTPNEGYEYLFMPMLNGLGDDTTFSEGWTDEQIVGFTHALQDTALSANGGSLFASIDGVSVGNLEEYRQQSDMFDYVLAEPPNLLGDWPGGLVSPAFADGFYLAIDLAALSPEAHTIKFGGTLNLAVLEVPDELGLEDWQEAFRAGESFTLDITYNLTFDLNEVSGTNGKDKNLRGTNKWDDISGLNGQDRLVGLEGNDVLRGGNGSDVLVGVNPNVAQPGCREIDILYGGNGPDTFVLGDAAKVYYQGHGFTDYALIKDLKTEDTIQLHGQRSAYQLSEDYSLGGKSGTSIMFNGELIGFVQGASDLSLTRSSFTFFG